MDEERVVWEGRSSHIKDFSFHLLCAVFFWLGFPLLMSGWRYLNTRYSEFLITNERIRRTSGVFSKRIEEVELYRIKDSILDQPFFLRLFDCANLTIRTSDVSTPTIILPAIRDCRTLRENLRGCVEKMRERKGVREVDYR